MTASFGSRRQSTRRPRQRIEERKSQWVRTTRKRRKKRSSRQKIDRFSLYRGVWLLGQYVEAFWIFSFKMTWFRWRRRPKRLLISQDLYRARTNPPSHGFAYRCCLKISMAPCRHDGKQHKLWVVWMRSDAVGPCCFVAGCCHCWMLHVFKRRQKFCKRGAARRVRIWLVQLRTFNGTKHVLERAQVFYSFLLRCNAYVNVDVCDVRTLWMLSERMSSVIRFLLLR